MRCRNCRNLVEELQAAQRPGDRVVSLAYEEEEAIGARHVLLTSSHSNWRCKGDYIRLPHILVRQLHAQQLGTVSLF